MHTWISIRLIDLPVFCFGYGCESIVLIIAYDSFISGSSFSRGGSFSSMGFVEQTCWMEDGLATRKTSGMRRVSTGLRCGRIRVFGWKGKYEREERSREV